ETAERLTATSTPIMITIPQVVFLRPSMPPGRRGPLHRWCAGFFSVCCFFDFHDGCDRAPSLNQLRAGGGGLPVVLRSPGKVPVGDGRQQASVEVGVARLEIDQAVLLPERRGGACHRTPPRAHET